MKIFEYGIKHVNVRCKSAVDTDHADFSWLQEIDEREAMVCVVSEFDRAAGLLFELSVHRFDWSLFLFSPSAFITRIVNYKDQTIGLSCKMTQCNLHC